MNKWFLLICILPWFHAAMGQSLVINGNIVISDASTEGAKFVIFKNSEKIDEQIIRKSRFEFKLAIDSDYRILFEKDGYITKIVSVNTEIPQEILETNSNFPPVRLIINLFPQVEGIDLSIFEQPIAILAYDHEMDDFIFDKDYTNKIKERIAQTEREIKRIVAERGSAALEKERMFAELTAKGENSFNQKKWTDALDNWQKALSIKPENLDVKNKIALAQKEKELEDARISIERQNAKSYELLVVAADSLFSKKVYAEAREKYSDALKLNNKDNYPSKKINEIDLLLENQAKEKLLAEKQQALVQNYKYLITQADQVLKNKNYDTAERLYQEALQLNYEKEYPDQQLKVIAEARKQETEDQQRAEQELRNKQIAAENERKLQEEQKRLQLKGEYDKLIADADKAFKIENYSSAKLFYAQADALNIGEEYPKKQLAEINNIINSAKYQAKLTEYNKNKTLAEKTLKEKNYASAKYYYQKALSILAVDKEDINKQIEEIDKQIEAEQLAEMMKAYKEEISKADKAFDEKAYAVAKVYYQKALSIKQGDEYAGERLKELEDLILGRKEKSVEL